jgi:membrane protein implicated in regulation of membrane protease activity
MSPFVITLLLGAALIGLEMVTGTLIMLSFGLGLLGVAAVQYLSGEFILTRDLLIFILISAASVFILRRLFRSRRDVIETRDDVNRY